MTATAQMAAAAGVLVTAAIGTWLARSLALRKHLYDHPNERSAHTAPTPRLGGLGLIIPFTGASLAVILLSGDVQMEILAVLGGVLVMAIMGLVDDVRSLPAKVRFLVQHGCAALVVAAVGGELPASLAPLDFLPYPLLAAAMVVWIAWITNLYNFMDGINGIAGSQTIIGAGAIALVGFKIGAPEVAWLAVYLAAATAGFLPFNFPKASIFMGDVGSTAIGFFLACVPLLPAAERTVPFEAANIAISLFTMDAFFTLMRRIYKRERFWQAHRSHLYQRLLAYGVGHTPITLISAAGMAVVGAAAVYGAGGTVTERLLAVAVPFVVFGALYVLARWVERGREETGLKE